MKTALTIAGSDSSGGAGIQADMKTMTANGVYAMSAVTALTAQNTTGVTDILESTPHFLGEQLDALFTDIFPGKWFHGKRINNPNTHGTGCTLSSAIASNLAKGYDLDESVERAKEYISGALAAMLNLGRGSGPMNHMFALKGAFTE